MTAGVTADPTVAVLNTMTSVFCRQPPGIPLLQQGQS